MGARFLLDQRRTVDRQILFWGTWEAKQIDALRAYAIKTRSGRPSVFLDIGSHWGLYAVLFAKEPWVSRTLAFEPDPRTTPQLHANVFLNHLTDRIEVKQVAVSDHAGSVSFSQLAENNSGASRVDAPDLPEFAPAIQVPSVKIDDLLSIERAHIVTKIDVEGHEEAVLRGMLTTLARNDCVLQVEIWPENEAGVTGILSEAGYTARARIDSDTFFTR